MIKLFLISIVVAAAIVFFIYPRSGHRTELGACEFAALDVGQGDALLVQTPDHQDILIDGGPSANFYQQLGRMLPPGDRDIELMVLTHPHADHVNGLVEVTRRFQVNKVLDTGVQFQQTAYQEWERLIMEKHIPEQRAAAGQRITVGTAATLDVLWPAAALDPTVIAKDNAGAGGGVNDSSIVIRLTCAGSTALLTGDASSDIEERVMAAGADVQASLLKVGHHGSRFSSGPSFLRAAKPQVAVISVGINNRYRHPHPTTLLHFSTLGIPILRTDLVGTIRLMSDGQGGWSEKQ